MRPFKTRPNPKPGITDSVIVFGLLKCVDPQYPAFYSPRCRDANATQNMLKLVSETIETGFTSRRFRRGTYSSRTTTMMKVNKTSIYNTGSPRMLADEGIEEQDKVLNFDSHSNTKYTIDRQKRQRST